MNGGTAFALLCIGLVVYQLLSGKIVGRGGWVTTRDKNPGLYWFTIAIEIAIVAVIIGLAVRNFLANGA